MSSLFPPESDSEPVYLSYPQAQYRCWYVDNLDQLSESGSTDEDITIRSNTACSGSDCTKQIESSAVDLDETLPPDSELEHGVDVDISEEGSEEGYDSQVDIFD